MIALPAEKRKAVAELRTAIKELEKPEREAKKIARAKARGKREKAMRGAPKEQRQVRQTEPGFLAYIRRQPCEAAHMGDCSGKIEAAHIRYSDTRAGSINPGLQRKNHDRFCNPLCAHHHRSDQHQRKERAFWESIGKDAYATAAAHYAAYRDNKE